MERMLPEPEPGQGRRRRWEEERTRGEKKGEEERRERGRWRWKEDRKKGEGEVEGGRKERKDEGEETGRQALEPGQQLQCSGETGKGPRKATDPDKNTEQRDCTAQEGRQGQREELCFLDSRPETRTKGKKTDLEASGGGKRHVSKELPGPGTVARRHLACLPSFYAHRDTEQGQLTFIIMCGCGCAR